MTPRVREVRARSGRIKISDHADIGRRIFTRDDLTRIAEVPAVCRQDEVLLIRQLRGELTGAVRRSQSPPGEERRAVLMHPLTFVLV